MEEEGEEIVVIGHRENTITVTATGGGGGGFGWGGWGGDAFIYATNDGWGGGGDASVYDPVYEEPLPEDFLPYTHEVHEDGTEVVRIYDFWNGRMDAYSIGPDGSRFSVTSEINLNDWSDHQNLNWPDSGWPGGVIWA